MSSSSSSAASPSPPPGSPAAVLQKNLELPNLERLVLHFVNAKKALNTSQHVERVTHLVVDSRRLIEETAILGAKNVFVTSKVHQQIDTLNEIHNKISHTGAEVDNQFQILISKLDAAHDRLQTTLESLRSVVVDQSLGKSAEDETTKTLFDFVDEAQYEGVSSSIRALIDTFQQSRTGIESSLDDFKSMIAEVAKALQSPLRSASPTSQPTIYDDPLLPVSEAFNTMEEHAAEMATLLQSLISHYDLCVSALKHTEGGREAAKDAVMAASTEQDPMDDSLFTPKNVASISEDERTEMLEVLEGDAEEVDGVVEDIRERGSALERLHGQFLRRSGTAKAGSHNLESAVKLLREIRVAIPTYTEAAGDFEATWHDVQTSIDAKLKEIVELRAFYEEFLSGYQRLLKEVERRRAVDIQMSRIAVKAQKELDQLYEADRAMREEFVEDVASFLPSDLWPGVAEPGIRYEINSAIPSLEDTTQPHEGTS